jgi:hypothetical protein
VDGGQQHEYQLGGDGGDFFYDEGSQQGDEEVGPDRRPYLAYNTRRASNQSLLRERPDYLVYEEPIENKPLTKVLGGK